MLTKRETEKLIKRTQKQGKESFMERVFKNRRFHIRHGGIKNSLRTAYWISEKTHQLIYGRRRYANYESFAPIFYKWLNQ